MRQEATEILCEVRIDGSDQDAMRALSAPHAMATWMQAEVDFEPVPGAAFHIEWDDPGFPGRVDGRVVDLQPDRWMVLSWRRAGIDAETQVRIDVRPDDGGSLVTLRHSGLPSDPDWTGARDMVRADWEKSLANLRFFVEEGGLRLPAVRLRRSVELTAPPERTYQVWSEAAHLAAWWLREASMELREGGPLRFQLQDGSTITGRLVLLQKHRHLRWIWQDGSARSMVGVSFWPEGSGSRVSVTQVGFGLSPDLVDRYSKEWDACLRELVAYVG